MTKFFLPTAAAIMLLGHSPAFAGAVLTVTLPTGSIVAGSIFTVGISVAGPTITHNGQTITSNVSDLAAFQFDLAFNCSIPPANPTSCQPGANVLQALSVSEGSFLPHSGSNPTFFQPGFIDNTAGQITFIGDVGIQGITGIGDLVDVTFRALTSGATSIAILSNNDLQFFDSLSNPIVVENAVTTSPDAQTFPTNQSLSATVAVATPEPAPALLLSCGALVLGLAAVRRKVAAAHRG